MKEYFVTFKHSYQISPDDWDVCNPALKVTNETTIGEIADWFDKYQTAYPMEVKIIELQNKTP
jgi:hypothetical protein